MEMLTGSDPITPEPLAELPLMPKHDPDVVAKDRRKRNLAVFDIMASVVHSAVPSLPAKTFSQHLESFIAVRCVEIPITSS